MVVIKILQRIEQTTVFIKTKENGNMDIESINKQIQTEKDSYNRDKNRLKQELSKLKDRHLRRLSDLQKLKEQANNINKIIEDLDFLLNSFKI